MNTLDDLRRLLETDADAAPGPDGLLPAVEQGASRIRRRRRVAAVAGAAALVAVVALVTPALTEKQHADGPIPASVPVERATGQLTVGVDPASGYEVTSRSIDQDAQRMSFRIPPAAGAAAERRPVPMATAIDPDAGFDPGRLLAGERTTVAGHEAWFVGDYPLGTYILANKYEPLRRQAGSAPVVGWQDPGGTWVLVHPGTGARMDRATLSAAAEAVRLTAVRDLTLPVSFGRLPAGLPLSSARTNLRDRATMTLGGTPAPLDMRTVVVGETPGTAVIIMARSDTRLPAKSAPVEPVAGHEAWYSPTTLGSARGNGTLLVRAGRCLVAFVAWNERKASAKQLREIADDATYADCTEPATWGPVVRR